MCELVCLVSIAAILTLLLISVTVGGICKGLGLCTCSGTIIHPNDMQLTYYNVGYDFNYLDDLELQVKQGIEEDNYSRGIGQSKGNEIHNADDDGTQPSKIQMGLTSQINILPISKPLDLKMGNNTEETSLKSSSDNQFFSRHDIKEEVNAGNPCAYELRKRFFVALRQACQAN